MSSIAASCLIELHTFECCDLYCLEELPVQLRMETGLCSGVWCYYKFYFDEDYFLLMGSSFRVPTFN